MEKRLDKLKLEMRIQNISVNKLSIMTGIPLSTLNKKFYNGTTFREDEIKKLCSSLGKTFEQLF